MRAIGDHIGKTGLVYFDAHPDFVSTTNDYYGSVLHDASRWIDFNESILIGTRSAEPEELENVFKVGLDIVTPLDINEFGITKIVDKVKAKSKKGKKYISIDLLFGPSLCSWSFSPLSRRTIKY